MGKVDPEFKRLARDLAENSIVTSVLARYLEQVIEELYDTQIAPLRKALRSIANNSCCEQCQEAKLVALAALADTPPPKTKQEALPI